MRERPNRTVSKTVESFGLRGFKSHSLRWSEEVLLLSQTQQDTGYPSNIPHNGK